MCCRKLSCLLLVVAQKSSRLMTSDSFSCSPAALTIVTLLFLPKGGLASTTSYSPCFAAKASLVTIGSSVSASSPMPCRSRFMAHTRYGRAALDRALASIVNALQGARQDTFLREGAAMFSLVAGGELNHSDAERELVKAYRIVLPDELSSLQRRMEWAREK